MKKYYSIVMSFLMAVLGTGSLIAQETSAYDYDFKASVLCGADWYGTRRSEGSHTVHNYYIVLGDKALNEEDASPAAGSTVYALDLFGSAPADEYNPQPPVGTYSFSANIDKNVLYHDIHVYQLDGNGNYEIDRDFKDGRLELSTYEKDGNTYYKYEAFLTDEIGKTHHVTYESRFITYNDLSQGSLDLEKDLDFTCINAYAKYRSINDGVMNIYLELSDMQKYDNDYVYDPLPGRQMIIELYMPSGQTLANGVYTPSDDAGEAFSMETGEIVNIASVQYPVGSYVNYIFANKNVSWGCVKTGTLTVSGEGNNKKIVGDFVTDYGFAIKFVYEGELPIDAIPQTGFGDKMALDLDGANAQFECVGDVERLNNCRNWYITLLPGDGKDHGFIAYVCSRGKTFFDGIVSETYTASPSRTPWKSEYSKGKKNDQGQLSGTWALTAFDESGQPQINAPANDGDIKIERHEDGETYTIEFNLSDGIGHDFSGKWTGKPELINSCGDVDEAGIDDIIANSDKTIEGIYDLNGCKVSGKNAGIYIIRYSDGTVSKSVVK